MSEREFKRDLRKARGSKRLDKHEGQGDEAAQGTVLLAQVGTWDSWKSVWGKMWNSVLADG